jgi:adenine-specific DNA-methyltransferase
MPHHPAKLPEDIRAYAREMRSKMTDAEALLWKLLRNRRIANAKFRRQHPLGRYILDFYCDDKKLGIELDSGQHGETVKYDKQRDDWLHAQGIQVLRFWNNQVLTETEAVMEVIYQEVVSTETSQTNIEPNTPSPAGGRGLG